MTTSGFPVHRHRGTSTSRVKRKTGEMTIAVSLGNFPIDVHQSIKDYSSKDRTVSYIYSEAISKLRVDINAGIKVTAQGIQDGVRDIKIWISEDAEEDLRFLVYTLRAFHKEIVHLAAVRWLEVERGRFDKHRKPHGSAP